MSLSGGRGRVPALAASTTSSRGTKRQGLLENPGKETALLPGEGSSVLTAGRHA